jgi:FtsP/CotA-like multicopper oxidase with cupredoxin domain
VTLPAFQTCAHRRRRITRRELLVLACGLASSSAVAEASRLHRHAPVAAGNSTRFTGDADVTLRIGEVTLELAPGRSIRTLAYNGQVPGPLLRVRAGRPLTVDVFNDSQEQDIVHWHGLQIPPEVDGAYEEGTPGVPPQGGRRRYEFTPAPAGTRWYHSHNPAGRNLQKSTYSGQFGLLLVESGTDSGAYDREVPILLHEWNPFLSRSGPLDVEYRAYTINGRMLGFGDPLRVKPSERVLFRIVNASATLQHRLALPGHLFHVLGLDGNGVLNPAAVSVVELGPGERADAIVEMTRPGVWIFGETRRPQRDGGMGVVVEYADRKGPPQWEDPPATEWDYSVFAGSGVVPEPDERRRFVFKAEADGHHWTINGKRHPRTDPIVVSANKRYRWVLDNQSAHHHPMHLHRHAFEVVRIADRRLSGLWTRDFAANCNFESKEGKTSRRQTVTACGGDVPPAVEIQQRLS